jgi:hypothetical protein
LFGFGSASKKLKQWLFYIIKHIIFPIAEDEEGLEG